MSDGVTQQRAFWVMLRGLDYIASARGQQRRGSNKSVTWPMLLKTLSGYLQIRGHKSVTVSSDRRLL